MCLAESKFLVNAQFISAKDTVSQSFSVSEPGQYGTEAAVLLSFFWYFSWPLGFLVLLHWAFGLALWRVRKYLIINNYAHLLT